MDRRAFLGTLVAGFLAAPLAAEGQSGQDAVNLPAEDDESRVLPCSHPLAA